jgi:hypothetical protein
MECGSSLPHSARLLAGALWAGSKLPSQKAGASSRTWSFYISKRSHKNLIPRPLGGRGSHPAFSSAGARRGRGSKTLAATETLSRREVFTFAFFALPFALLLRLSRTIPILLRTPSPPRRAREERGCARVPGPETSFGIDDSLPFSAQGGDGKRRNSGFRPGNGRSIRPLPGW